MKKNQMLISILITSTFLLSACVSRNTPSLDGRLQVLATTSIVAEIVQQVGGEYITVTTLIPVGADPHEFSPRPQDVAAIVDADIVFANGAGLEEFLNSLLESAGGTGKLVEVSGGIDLITWEGAESGVLPANDPHTWMNPNNVLIWLTNITAALSAADPDHTSEYVAKSEAYASLLQNLDTWIRSVVEQIPAKNRMIVSDHAVLGYFIDEYGFSQGGTITDSFSTEAAPSARELAALEEEIRNSGVRAIFVTEPSNRTMADQIAQDTGIRAVWIYHASLTDASGPAPTYLDFMRYNVSAIVEALK